MDVTYPFFPIASILAAFLLFLFMITSALRRSWNFGIFMSCLGLLCEDLTFGVNSILWADDADIKHWVWCDLATHLQLFGVIVIPAGSLIVTRKLYHVAKERSLEYVTKWQRRFDLWLEIFLLIILPALYVGLFYYAVQQARFQVLATVGCTNAIFGSGMSVLLLDIPTVVLPAISVLFYCPSIIWIFYKQRRQSKRLLEFRDEASYRTNYSRLFAIGCLDIVLTLPINAIGLFLDTRSTENFGFYPGWDTVHADWEPFGVPEEVWRASGFWIIFTIYFTPWANVVLSLAIVAVFGSSHEAWDIYRQSYGAIAKRLGIKLNADAQNSLSTLAFDSSSGDTPTNEATTNISNIVAETSASSPKAVGKFGDMLKEDGHQMIELSALPRTLGCQPEDVQRDQH